MKDDHDAFAQGNLFGDDIRLKQLSAISMSVLKNDMPWGLTEHKHKMIATLLTAMQYSAFLRFIRIAADHWGKMPRRKLVTMLAEVNGDLPNLETCARAVRKITEKHDELCKWKLKKKTVLKKRRRNENDD